MIDSKRLLTDLQKLLKTLEDDIRERCGEVDALDRQLREQHATARDAGRTAQAYEPWRDEQITQAAVAWILGCVFVRFCEDNNLVDPPRLAGPGERLRRAQDEHTHYFQQHPTHSDREYLEFIFAEVGRLPAMKELFDRRHNPLWSLGVSGDGATVLLEFWQKRDAASGVLIHDFTDPQLQTRFLGDLYQDLSESARKKFALLQTPGFVEEFILDRTLTPAIDEFGFQQVRMIDPTCGSGHFLLGGFTRLFNLWANHEPATNVRELAQRALNGVYGVDLNPYAVAIARFRLLVAALSACEIRRLADAPGFTINLAAGDSLLHGPRPGVVGDRQQFLLGEDPLAHVYEVEDADLLRRFLGQQYHAVVGNPPYITPKDKALNDEYRRRFGACHMQYSLSVPFFERFFDLAANCDPPGFVGMITANSFMKREFGKKLIEQYIPQWHLTHVIDTSGACIPGHKTPTVVVFGRNRSPASSTIRLVMGITGDPATLAEPAQGPVWSAIVAQVDLPGSQSRFVSVCDTPWEQLRRHPWSIGGGGAAELKGLLDQEAESTLSNFVTVIGRGAHTGEDDAYVADPRSLARRGVASSNTSIFVEGDRVRDWHINQPTNILFPYADDLRVLPEDLTSGLFRWLWPLRSLLWERREPNGSHRQIGKTWYEYSRFHPERYAGTSIAMAFVATHNHYVLDSGVKVFNRSAPVIKLSGDASVDTLLGLLGLLNSSVACFYMRETNYPTGGFMERWEERRQFNATAIEVLPLPAGRPLEATRHLVRLARDLSAAQPDATSERSTPSAVVLADNHVRRDTILARMVALQEELDWECYALYGLLESPPRHEEPPPIHFGQRAFEIVLARQAAAGEIETMWFERHGSTPITEIPADWPEDYKQVLRRRIEIIENDRNIALIERPEYKRRWNTEPWEAMQERALRSWLLDRLEGWPLEQGTANGEQRTGPAAAPQSGPGEPGSSLQSRSLIWNERDPRLVSVAQLADRVRQDKDFMQVAALYRGHHDFDLTRLVAELVEDEAVPFLPVLRYKESGLRNRQVWEQVWDLQRQEDAIDARTKLPADHPQHLTERQAKAEKKRQVGDIPVPPKYKSADMLNGTIWRLRGKLDVPKERFVSFPFCGRDADPTLMITWAGFDHLQQMQALSAYYVDMKEREAWPAERRVPLLAGMLELLPWVIQWHNELDPSFDQPLGDFYHDFMEGEIREMGLTTEQVRAWQPPARATRRKKAGSR